MQHTPRHTTEPGHGTDEPTWEVAWLFPSRGCWTEEDYCALDANRLVELSDGHLEVLPMPTEEHQSIVAFLYQAFYSFVAPRGLGKVLFAPLRVRLWELKFREPDLVFMLAEHADRRSSRHWRGADIAVEVVSDDDPDRDLRTKRAEYARAGIQEYWIVDPRDTTITVLTLDESGEYRVAGRYGRGEQARSVLLPGLSIDAEGTFAAAEQ